MKLRDHKCRKVTEPDFSGKLYYHFPKNGQKGSKNGQKRPKNRFFGILRKSESLVFARNDLKWSLILLANFLHKYHIWENSCSQDLGQKRPKKGKNRFFGLLRKMSISKTTAKDFENLISYLNSWWNVLSDWCGPLKMGAKLGNIKAQIGPKIGFLDICEKLSY